MFENVAFYNFMANCIIFAQILCNPEENWHGYQKFLKIVQ